MFEPLLYIPPRTKRAIDDYVKNRHRHGNFIMMVLSGKRREVEFAADPANQRHLPDIFKYLQSLPEECHGSPEKVEKWLSSSPASCSGQKGKPKIFVFSGYGGGDGPCYAMAEDGHVLGQHWCSSEGWAIRDLGVEKGSRPDRHREYAKHYPDGYEMVFVPAREIESNEELKAAMKLNDEIGELAEEEISGA